ALADTRPVLVVLLVAVGLHAGLSWTLVFGHFGLPAFRVAGAVVSIAINHSLMFGGLALYLRLAPHLRDIRLTDALARCGRIIGPIVRLGLPIGAILGLEIGVFGLTGVLMGLLGTAALGAHQLVMNVVAI